MCLVLAASGNWGKHGTGIRCWASGMHDGAGHRDDEAGPRRGQHARSSSPHAMPRSPRCKQMDPTMTTEIAVRELGRCNRCPAHGWPAGGFNRGEPDARGRRATRLRRRHSGGTGRPATESAGTSQEWGDESLPRTFDEYFNEALAKGWWDGLDQPRPEEPPQCPHRVRRQHAAAHPRRQEGASPDALAEAED